MEFLSWLVVQLFWIIESIVSWVIFTLVWLAFWILLPMGVLAFVAIRVADYLLGRAVVWLWLQRQLLKFGGRTWRYARRTLFALSALPFRVLIYLMFYGLWHSILVLFWRPRWSPWERAWSKRWRKHP